MNDRHLPSDPYQVLGVTSQASSVDIARAYRRLARTLHPDSRPADTDAADRLRAVIAAHELLSDPARRAAYDNRRPRHAVRPRTDPDPGIFAVPPASQLHPLDRTDTTRPAPTLRPGTPVQPGPVRIEPSTPHGLRDDTTLSEAEWRLLQLFGEPLRYRRYRPW